ncbi:hypothetical protein [Streptomyces iconiensis]|uniref:Uncharacterized protein n=1 Tax=Streptomyces iconiensis TaxID=1384038 RepID=A0ABT7A3T0_9ACTN|nr:hypothetical protein [Streptomyces iconiensis]MDJ1135951.1 hypothetical protein [Streptomyces iconiensis]
MGARVGEWRHRHRKALLVTGLVVVVLALVAVLVREPVKDEWLARRACDGQLPRGELDTVRTDLRLEGEKAFHSRDLGQYRCLLENTDGKVVVSVNAYTRPADQRQELSRIGKEYQPQKVLPGGLPGFASDNGDIHLMPKCPRLGKDFDGQPRRMLATTWVPFASRSDQEAALLRMAVTMANDASDKLGCGAKPLPAPKKDAVATEGKEIPRSRAQGTACGALADTSLLGKARDAKVRVAVSDEAPVGRCTLSVVGGADKAGGDEQRVVELTSWYGDWAGGTGEMGSGDRSYFLRADGSRAPLSGASDAWATARCDGENAGFAAHWGYAHGDGYKVLDGRLPKTKSARAELLRELVARFAKDQVKRKGCAGLKVPGERDSELRR